MSFDCVTADFARELEMELNAVRSALQAIVDEAKPSGGLQCGAPSLISMYVKAELIDNAKEALFTR